MEIAEQTHLADVLRDYRERLERARGDLSADGGGVRRDHDPIADRLLEVEKRMLDVENYLLDDVRTRRQRRRERWRATSWTTPGIGRLRQHAPLPLRVPTSYYTAHPPRPAPTISIVTPSYQQGRFLERTLYSVLAQNYPALEYHVQDGASQDQTLEILRRYESGLAGWESEPDRGQGEAINRGFARTGGEIMAYLNSDDLLLPGSLAYVAGYLAAHPDVDVVYGHRLLIDEFDRQIGTWVLPAHDEEELTLVDYVPQETLFWRRRAWDAVGGRIDTSLRFAIDWELLLRLREAGASMVRLPRFLGAFRVHPEQKTNLEQDVCLAECDLLRRRVHGRTLSAEEVVARAAPYVRRQLVHQAQHRLAAKLPVPRTRVRTLPSEPGS